MIKKIIRSCIVVFSFLLLNACTSIVDSRILLPKRFLSHAKVMHLKTPRWRVSDSVYNTKLDRYRVQNVHTTWQSSQEKLENTKIENNFLDYLLFDRGLYYIVKEFDIEGRQQFSFNLTENGDLKAISKCEIFSQSSGTNTLGIRKSSVDISSNSLYRNKTFLACSMRSESKHWELTLKSYKGEPIEVELHASNSVYRIENISRQYDILSNGEKRVSPPWLSLHSGLKVYKNNKIVSAVSFLDKAKIWIANNLSNEDKIVLLSVDYSLMMFNWLDDKWK